ncbi:hypothetical protein AAFF_G00213730 [Aldrovandia affinis]|uniref:Uncharacterized protein n=1 Tax=Aldrovandia affinis TaxID=143900 RepID=A0AAD7W5A4_9TELE|nr:hypothetical protein AAFF_G00213730 [Aldrovandia affinis]
MDENSWHRQVSGGKKCNGGGTARGRDVIADLTSTSRAKVLGLTDMIVKDTVQDLRTETDGRTDCLQTRCLRALSLKRSV